MPALAAKSAIVSKTLRGALVSGSNCSMRASMISIAGVTKSVAASTSNSVTPGPLQRLAEDERQLDLDARRDEAAERDVAAVREEHVVHQRREVGLGDLRGLLHRPRRQADLAALIVRPSASSSSTQARWIA